MQSHCVEKTLVDRIFTNRRVDLFFLSLYANQSLPKFRATLSLSLCVWSPELPDIVHKKEPKLVKTPKWRLFWPEKAKNNDFQNKTSGVPSNLF
jgi:hypothetical protein